MKKVTIPLGLAGLALAIALIAWRGAGEVGAALLAAGWGLAFVVLYEILPLTAEAIGWRVLLHGPTRPLLVTMVWARWIRQSVNQLLPVAQLGGEFVGARLMTMKGIAGSAAGASVVVDLTLSVAAQMAFTVFALAMFVAGHGGNALTVPVVAGIALLLAGITGFYVAQRRGLFGKLAKGASWFTGREALAWSGGAARLDQAVGELYRAPRLLWRNFAWQAAAWAISVGEVLIALALLGHPVSLVEALVIQGIGRAVRSAAFAVPAGIGVQEGGYMLVCAALGIGADIGLALSLIKRGRELAFGVPGLIAWQAAEGRRWWRQRPSGRAG